MNKLNLKILTFLYCCFALLPVVAIGQSKQLPANQSTPAFKNQGEQEEYWAKELFETSYKSMKFERYKGNIVSRENVFHFADETITIHGDEPNYTSIFQNGLMYPGILNGNVKGSKLSDSEIKKLTEQQRVFYNMGRTDSVIISALEECKFLNPNFKQRRFKFWLSRPGLSNPTVYFFELTNEKANKRTSLDAFLRGARLTFFKKGWIII